MVLFGQIIVGPPGAGKTFYCRGMQSFMEAIGRKCAIVNLDFANDTLPYAAAVDVRDLVSLERVMEEFELGPNGGLVYCMEYLLENIDWLLTRLKAVEESGVACVLFDCPGQVELYTHHTCVKSVVDALTKGQRVMGGTPAVALDCRLCSVHLVDSFYCWCVWVLHRSQLHHALFIIAHVSPMISLSMLILMHRADQPKTLFC